jgi:hypothetical protein
MQIGSQNQAALAIGGVVALLLVALAVLLVRRLGSKKLGTKIDPQLADDLARGNYADAAERELQAGRLPSAYDLFLRAQQPMRAAQVAVRQGRLQEAAELFERVGSRKRAADLYKQVGMQLKADQLLAEDERAAREREEQKAALRKRLEAEPEEDVASLDRARPPVKTPTPPPAVARPAALDLGGVTPPAPTGDRNVEAAAKPETPSLFGIQALLDRAAGKTTSEALALAATQAAMASLAAKDGDQGGEDLRRQLGAPVAAGPASEPVFVTPAAPAPEPGSQEFALGEAKPAVEELSLGASQPAAAELSFGDAPAAAEEPALVEPKAAEVGFALDPAESGPVLAPPIVEGLPEAPPRSGRTTPRTPMPAVGPSVGAYRMVRPSEPDVFTPPPSLRAAGAGTPAPRPRTRSGEHQSGERRTPPPTPRPSLSLGTRPGPAARQAQAAEQTPGGTGLGPSGLAHHPATPPPVPRTSSQGTVLGLGAPRREK